MLIKNLSVCKEAESFFKDRIAGYETDNLVVTMKDGCLSGITGFCRYPFKKIAGSQTRSGGYFNWKSGTFRITAKVPSTIHTRFPSILSYTVGTKQGEECPLPGQKFEWIWDKETANDLEEAMVWILGHEVWHFLCKTKQERGNYQTKANAFGFKLLREFKRGGNKMFSLQYASPHTLEMLTDKGAEVLQVGFNEHLVTFKKGGLDEMKRKMQKEKEVKVKAKAKINTKVNGKVNSKPEAKKQGDSRTTKELKALLKEKGVKFTQIMKLADMQEIADHPEKEKEVIEKVRNRWKAYLKELEERKKKNE